MEFISTALRSPIAFDATVFLFVLIYLLIRKIMTIQHHAPITNDEIRVIHQSTDTIQGTCGHTGPKWFHLNCYGADQVMGFGEDNCPDCLIQHLTRRVTRCSACGLPIFPHSGVTILDASTMKLKYKGVSISLGGSQYLGCTRMNCGSGGASFAGYWTGNEFQPIFNHRAQVPIKEQ